MASCEEVTAGLDRYIDDELGREERLDFESHLADCPECSRGLAERRAAMGMLAEWSEPSGGARAAARRPAGATLRLALAAAAALLAVGLFAGLHLEGRPARVDGPPAGEAAAGGRDEGAGEARKLSMRGLDQGVKVLRDAPGGPVELEVDPFPTNWRTLKDGVRVIHGKSGGPDELVVDPFPEEGE